MSALKIHGVCPSFSHHLANQAGEDCAHKAAHKCHRDGIKQLLHLGLTDVNCGNIEYGFAAAHNHARTAGDVTVRAIGCKDILQNAIAAAAREGAQQHQFHKFGWDAQRIKKR